MLAQAARALPGVEITAAADLYEGRRVRATEIAGAKCSVSGDARRVIESKDVDAVVIATSDHWHVPLATAAAAADKDVYCETPVTHSLAESDALAKAFAGKRLFQCGGAQICTPLYIAAREQIQAGRLGRVSEVHGIWETASSIDAWRPKFPPDASPETIDWKGFLGAAPGKDFDLYRFFRWQRYWDYGAGLAGARFAIQLTAIQWLLDAAAPERVTAAGGIRRWKDGREVPDAMTAVFEYEGFLVSLTATQNGGQRQELRLVGADGTLQIGENALSFFPEPLSEPYPDTGESWPKEYRDWFYMIHSRGADGQLRTGAPVTKTAETFELGGAVNAPALHLADFLDAVRFRRAPRGSAGLGLAAAAAAHRANESYRQERASRDDPIRGESPMKEATKKAVLLVAALVPLVSFGVARTGAASLREDQGAAGTWQKLQKLQTTASAMHTTAHPDDEHGGVLSWLSRGQGARLALLTLNRGESGDNAIGSELFDGIGLIRTEELIDADRYYGVDDQYFTTVIDYGFSKRLEEALDKWGKENVLRDVVRVIRINRPYVLISRFQGNQRDGHGNHQTAGLITTEAFKVSGDPKAFPEQIAEGLRAWQPLKVYIGGQRENEDWAIRVDPGQYSPWLGETYNNFSRIGLSFQRSQNSGRLVLGRGPQYGYYKRVGATVASPDKEQGFFDGIDTTLSGLFKTLGRPAPAGGAEAIAAIEKEVAAAVAAFKVTDTSACVPALARGLKATRDALKVVASEPEAVFLLKVKEQQFQDAITTALGVDFAADARPAGLPEPTGPFAAFAPPPTMGAAVAGQKLEIRAQLTNRGGVAITPTEIALETGKGWNVTKAAGSLKPLKAGETAVQRFNVAVADDAPLSSKSYFTRNGIQQSRYDLVDPKQIHRAAATPAVVAVARYTVDGVPVEVRDPVRRREANLPFGYEERELMVVPAIALTVTPGSAVVPVAAARKQIAMRVDLVNNWEGEIAGQLALKLPAGWTSTPASHAFKYGRSGERTSFAFTVGVGALENKGYEIQAVATAQGKEFKEGYDVIAKRDLETRYLYRPATTSVRGIDVSVPAGLNVGYVMGVGDQVPDGIAQLGAKVTLLGEKELASANLKTFDAIMTGTRAYAVREDLKTYNQRLLDYAKEGGNLIVLYNTQEFVPNKWAAFPAELPQRAEEVSEEDSPVEILAPNEQVFNWPNKISKADFDGWMEQRGSKFFTEWDKAYTPLIATWDEGQEPQKGGWVSARSGKGHYTYFAYAFHRQLPYGVPGAYRLLANVLSLGQPRPAAAAAAKPAGGKE